MCTESLRLLQDRWRDWGHEIARPRSPVVSMARITGAVMVEISERAAARINEVLTQNPEYVGLRVGLKDGGCSGYAYLMDFESGPDEDDVVFERDGARVYVHPLHLPFLMGSALGWAESELQSGFHLENPQVSRMCGCGESFDVKLS